MRINKSRDYVQHKVKQPKNKAYVQIQDMWLWFYPLRNSIFIIWSIWSLIYFEDHSPAARASPRKNSHVKGNSFIETFQKSKVCILLEWFNPCKYQDFPLSHGMIWHLVRLKVISFHLGVHRKVRFGENLVQLTPVKTLVNNDDKMDHM